MKRAGYKCENCNARANLQAHHITYERFHRELPEDLKILCQFCHTLTHGGNPGRGNRKVKATSRPIPRAIKIAAQKEIRAYNRTLG